MNNTYPPAANPYLRLAVRSMKNFTATLLCLSRRGLKTKGKRSLPAFALFVVFALVSISSNAQTYCTTSLYPDNCPGYSWISVYTIKTSGGTQLYTQTTTCTGGTGVADYTGTPICTLNPGSAYVFYITDAAAYSDYAGIWIDFNDNGSFGDAGEFLGAATINGSGPSVVQVSVAYTVPAGATTGNHRMRIRVRNATPAFTLAASCTNSGNDGEAQDYTVTIQPPCTIPGTPSFTGGAAALCVGGTTTYTATATGNPTPTYQWSVASGATIGSVSGTVTNVTSNYTVSVSAINTCGTVTNSEAITVYTLPVVNSVAAPASACVGTALALTATTTPGSGGAITTYNWTGTGNGLASASTGVNTNSATPTFPSAQTYPASITYSVSVTDTKNCSSTAAGTTSAISITAPNVQNVAPGTPGTNGATLNSTY